MVTTHECVKTEKKSQEVTTGGHNIGCIKSGTSQWWKYTGDETGCHQIGAKTHELKRREAVSTEREGNKTIVCKIGGDKTVDEKFEGCQSYVAILYVPQFKIKIKC